MEPKPTPSREPAPLAETLSWEASVTVCTTAAGAWCARAVLADHSERLFDSPFELARFFASTGSSSNPPTRGLR